MLSLGMPDLRGHLGIGYDASAWLDSAYNASLMFIGPFSVYLGGLLGPRRVLLFAAGVFALTCIYLPFIHSYSLLIVALIVAGSDVWYVLSAYPDLRSAQYSASLSAIHHRVVCNVCGRRGERRTFALRLVQRLSLLAMDVLGLRGDCAVDDGLHLFWYSGAAASQGKRAASQLCRISLSEFRISYGLCRSSARRAARLVALRSVQRLVLVRSLLPAVCA